MKNFFTLFLLLICAVVFCQSGGVSISPGGGAPDPSAALDIQYTNKGFLMPRLTSAQMTSINVPATGLLVYNTDSNAFYYYSGSIWTNVSSVGNNLGDMLYWNGINWVIVPAGTNGQVLTFTNGVPTWTAPAVFLPTVLSTTTATAITQTTASSGGNITSNGGATVTAYGVCWGTSPNPVLGGGNYTTDGSGTGTFTSSITGLSPGANYYVRAYATNSVGTAYGAQITFTTLSFAVGDAYEGGIIAYILKPGDAGYNANVVHGLIAATSDQSTGIQWYNGSYTATGATGTAIGTGASNTALIIASQGTGNCSCYAASVCTAYTGGGYTDWYLPSVAELNELYINEAAIGGFTGSMYWSSSEEDNFHAWFEYLTNGGQSGSAKINTLYVRAIRSF